MTKRLVWLYNLQKGWFWLSYIILVWTDSCRWCGNRRCCRSFSIKAARPAQPLESHRFSGDEKTRLQTWHLRSSGPTSALIISGNARPMSQCTAYTNRPQRRHATVGQCGVLGPAAEPGPLSLPQAAKDRRTWKIEFLLNICFKHCYSIRWLQWFLSTPHARQSQILLLHGGVTGLARGLKKYSTTWASNSSGGPHHNFCHLTQNNNIAAFLMDKQNR